MVSRKLLNGLPAAQCIEKSLTTDILTVKFHTAKLPAILNSLETQNNGQKLVLEVSVCRPETASFIISIIN